MIPLWKVVIWVGLVPWLLGVPIYFLAHSGQGLDAMNIGIRDCFKSPLAAVPVVATAIFVALDWRLSAMPIMEDRNLRAFVTSFALVALMITAMSIIGAVFDGEEGSWMYIYWGMVSLHIPVVTISAALVVGLSRQRRRSSGPRMTP